MLTITYKCAIIHKQRLIITSSVGGAIMAKKYRPEQKRQWLQYREQGKSDKWIANYFKCDVRTVVKGIDEAIRGREAGAARIQLIKDKIGEHQTALVVVLDGIVSMLELPPYNLEIHRESNGHVAPIPLSGALVKPDTENELVLVVHEEDSLKWELLKEHLKGDKLWRMINRWRSPFLEHIKTRVALLDAAQRLLEKETGLKLIKRANEVPDKGGLFPVAVKVFYELAICKALGVKNETNLKERLIGTPDGYVRSGPGGTEYAYAPGFQDECKEKILVALNKLHKSREKGKVISSYIEAEEITEETRIIAEEISLMRWLPGRCRVCKRMGI